MAAACDASALVVSAREARVAGRVEASLRHLEDAVARCPGAAPEVAALRLEALVELGQCARLAEVPGASPAARPAAEARCAEHVRVSGASLVRLASQRAGAEAAALWDRARVALEREESTRARVVEEALPPRVEVLEARGVLVGGAERSLIFPHEELPDVLVRVVPSPFDRLLALAPDGASLLGVRGDAVERRAPRPPFAITKTYAGLGVHAFVELSADGERILASTPFPAEASAFVLVDAVGGGALAEVEDVAEHDAGGGLLLAQWVASQRYVAARFMKRGGLILDARTGREVLRTGLGDFAVSADDRFVVWCTGDEPNRRITVFDGKTGKRGKGDGLPCELPMVDGTALAASKPGEKLPWLDLETGKRMAAPPRRPPPAPVAPVVRPGALGRALAPPRSDVLPPPLARADGRIVLGDRALDVDTGDRTPCAPSCDGRPLAASFRPRGGLLVELSSTNLVTLFARGEDVALARGVGSFESGGEAARVVGRGAARELLSCRVGSVVGPYALCEGRVGTQRLSSAP